MNVDVPPPAPRAIPFEVPVDRGQAPSAADMLSEQDFAANVTRLRQSRAELNMVGDVTVGADGVFSLNPGANEVIDKPSTFNSTDAGVMAKYHEFFPDVAVRSPNFNTCLPHVELPAGRALQAGSYRRAAVPHVQLPAR